MWHARDNIPASQLNPHPSLNTLPDLPARKELPPPLPLPTPLPLPAPLLLPTPLPLPIPLPLPAPGVRVWGPPVSSLAASLLSTPPSPRALRAQPPSVQPPVPPVLLW